MKKKTLLLMLPLLWIFQEGKGQCVSTQNVFAFTYDGKIYEIIKENKTWLSAAACAVSRGGYLAEVNSIEENDAIFSQLANAGIDPDDTAAPDGFSSYIWLGGNDITNEGNWVWNGNNDAEAIPFWQGTASGSAVNARFSNWGNEPDNWGSGTGQDGLAMAVIDWPLGAAGHWNDVKHTNTLYFVVEYTTTMGTGTMLPKTVVTLYPNPVKDVVKVTAGIPVKAITVATLTGQEVNTVYDDTSLNRQVSVAHLPAGVYIVNVYLDDNSVVTQKIIKE